MCGSGSAMSANIQVLPFLAMFSIFVACSYAAARCPENRYWNGTLCIQCSRCPVGYGVKVPCGGDRDIECRPCTLEEDFSNTIGMAPCISCDVNYNCPLGNSKVVRKCTPSSPPLCRGCADGSFLRADIGPNGKCLKCSPPCGSSQKETRKCTTEHDRGCADVHQPDSERDVSSQLALLHITYISAIAFIVMIAFLAVFCYKMKRRNNNLGSDIESEPPQTFQSSHSEPAETNYGKLMAIQVSFPESPSTVSGKLTGESLKVKVESDSLQPQKEPDNLAHVASAFVNDHGIDCITTDHSSVRTPPITVQSFRPEPAPVASEGLLRESSNVQEESNSFQPQKEPGAMSHITRALVSERKGERVDDSNLYSIAVDHLTTVPEEVKYESLKLRESDSDQQHKEPNETNYHRASSVSENFLRTMWDIAKLPDNADREMFAAAFMDHNGGKLTIGDTGVCLIIPPQAIPEGRTELIFIAIVNQEKGHSPATSKEPLLSPVVKCGPDGLKFNGPVILSIPHCAHLGNDSWNLKVHCNEAGTPTDWKELIDVKKQGGSQSALAMDEDNVISIWVNHFTLFAVTGVQSSTQKPKKQVKVVPYATLSEGGGYCAVRIYCVPDTQANLQAVHNQEILTLRGAVKDAPKPLDVVEGGGDVLVRLTEYHLGWINTPGDLIKVIHFPHIWEDSKRMPSCTFLFKLACTNVKQFHAAFEVKQENQDDGNKQKIIICTTINHWRPNSITSSDSSHPVMEQSGASAASPNSHNATNMFCFHNTTAAVILAGSVSDPAAQAFALLKNRPNSLGQASSSGYCSLCSLGFEPLRYTDVWTQRLRHDLIVNLDPEHPKAYWKHVAEEIGLEMTHIRWWEGQTKSPTDALLTYMLELRNIPFSELVKILSKLGRDDVVTIIENHLRETDV